ncbi:MAG: cytochrome c oxidase assembly protein, partial [Vicinamibacteria bacterium]
LLALPPRALYVETGDLTRLTPLQDQHLGGAIMLLVGGIVYLLGGLGLTVGLLRGSRALSECPR